MLNLCGRGDDVLKLYIKASSNVIPSSDIKSFVTNLSNKCLDTIGLSLYVETARPNKQGTKLELYTCGTNTWVGEYTVKSDPTERDFNRVYNAVVKRFLEVTQNWYKTYLSDKMSIDESIDYTITNNHIERKSNCDVNTFRDFMQNAISSGKLHN